jgi:hypothetical protein
MASTPDLSLDEFQITAIDFISVYAGDFGILDENLHGYGSYRFSEYLSRKTLVSDALRQLVLSRLLVIHATQSGYTYSISDQGMEFFKRIDNSYAKEYVLAVKAVLKRFNGVNSVEMNKEIDHVTALSIKETSHE